MRSRGSFRTQVERGETCVSEKSPGDADAAGPRTTLQGRRGPKASPVPAARTLTWFGLLGPQTH